MSGGPVSDKTAVEAVILSSAGPVGEGDFLDRLGYVPDVNRIVAELNEDYRSRGIRIVEVRPGRFAARTRPEASDLCRGFLPRPPKLSRAGLETLAVIAYFQPVTRAEIERVRGVALSPGTLETLIYGGLIRIGPRRASPGTPMTFLTTEHFLDRFNVRAVEDLPDYAGLRAAGLLNAEKGFTGPAPSGRE